MFNTLQNVFITYNDNRMFVSQSYKRTVMNGRLNSLKLLLRNCPIYILCDSNGWGDICGLQL